ncbi:hypothetical protein [Egicoccus sp. AB-alg2]|uniref:hypothetical protein n=1 Tax=Egicoccus sp. AB-alg2 TaxID=3242693 RepID=UPI00359D617F
MPRRPLPPSACRRRAAPARGGLLLAVLLLAGACTSGDGGGASAAREAGDDSDDVRMVGNAATVDGVTLTVPDGWRTVDTEVPPDVVGSHRWSPGANDVRNLQVVVGCGGTVDELVDGTLQSPRGPLVVTGAQEDRAQQRVPGLDAARRLTLTFGAGRDDDAQTIRTDGLYGHTGDALVLVEVSQQARTADGDLADRVLDAVEVDEATVTAACQGQP